MKRAYLFFGAALAGGALLIAGCNLGMFTSTTISDSTLQDLETRHRDAASQTINAGNLTVTVGTFDAASDGQTVTFDFTNEEIDQESLSDAVTFRRLTDGTQSGGTFERKTILNPDQTEYQYAGGDTTVTYTFDLSADNTISDPIEIEADASALTAGDGLWQLDTDGDGVPGESPEDNLIGYVGDGDGSFAGNPNFFGDVINENVDADGTANPRNPRATLTALGAGPAPTVGDTSIDVAYMENDVDVSTLNNAVNLLKYNMSAGEWESVSYSGSLDTGADTFTLDGIPTIEDGDVYKVNVDNPYDVQEESPTNGYRRRASYDQNSSSLLRVNPIEVLDGGSSVLAGGNSSYTSSGGGPIVDGGSYDSNRREIFINFDETVIGTEGLESGTVTKGALRLFDDTNGTYIPWHSVQVADEDAANDGVYFAVSASAAGRLDVHDNDAMGNDDNIEVHVGPSVKSLGDNADDSGDDLFLGDLLNTGYGQFRVETALQL